jgi:hypothetical protein
MEWINERYGYIGTKKRGLIKFNYNKNDDRLHLENVVNQGNITDICNFKKQKMTFYYDYNLRKIFRIDEDAMGRSVMGQILPLSFQFEPVEPEATHFRKDSSEEYLMIKTHKKRVTVVSILKH